MRYTTQIRTSLLAVAAVGLLGSASALAQSKVFPAGTDCGSLSSGDRTACETQMQHDQQEGQNPATNQPSVDGLNGNTGPANNELSGGGNSGNTGGSASGAQPNSGSGASGGGNSGNTGGSTSGGASGTSGGASGN